MALNKVEICGVNTARLPLLKNEEKEALFERIKEGDLEARELYIKGNLRLVLSVIRGKVPEVLPRPGQYRSGNHCCS